MNILRNKFGMGKICFLAGAFSFLIFGSGFALNAEETSRRSFRETFLQHRRHPKRQNLRSGKSEKKPQAGGRIFSTSIRPFLTSETKLTESCYVFGLDWYGSKIIFASSKDNNLLDIFSIPSSGGSMTNLTNTSGPEWWSRYSNDGSKIYYVCYDLSQDAEAFYKMNSDGSVKTVIKQFSAGNELGEICINSADTKIAYTLDESLWVMNSDGTNNTELTEAREWASIDFSRDDNYIVFADTNNHISKININTKALTQLTTEQYCSYPDWSPVEDKIVFQGYDASWQQDIWVMNSDGTGKTNLTNLSSGYPYKPQYSPDGTKITYTLEYSFWVMNSDGSNKIKIADADGWDSVWSPDSSKIAYSDSQNIFVVNSDGTNEQNITNNILPTRNGNPCWNSNFTKFAYIAEYSWGVYKLAVMNSDGSSGNILDSVYSSDRCFSFAPHSTKIVYTGTDRNIYSINYNGTGKTQLTTGGQSSYPSWSPDLSKIAYYSGSYDPYYLKIMDADGSNQTSLTDANESYIPPSWSSDGTEIVYLAGSWDNFSVWIVNVLSPSQKTEVVSGISSDACYSAFSPDGTKIAYTIEDYNNPDNEGLWVVNRDGSSKTQIYQGEPDWNEKPVWTGNDRIYFASDFSILSVKPDGTDLRNESTYKWNFAINPSDGSNLISSAFDIFSGIQSPVSIYSVSGYVKDSDGTGIIGVTVSCTGESSCTTSSSGYYAFTNLTSGNYTVTPSKTGLVFIPSNRSYSPLNSDQSNQNFTGGPTLYCINGSVKDDGGNAMRDVVLSVTGDAVKDYTSDISGNYEIILSSGNYTITPSKSKWSFTPVSRSYSPLDSDQTYQENYIGVYVSSGETTIEILTGQSEIFWSNGQNNPGDPFNTYFHDSRAQSVYLASDLTAAGMFIGTINALQLKCYQAPGRPNLKDFRIRIKQTSATTSTAWVTTGWTVAYGPTNIVPTTGQWYTFTLSTPFDWDGSSNLLIDFSRDDTNWAVNGGMYVRTDLSNRTYSGYGDSNYTWPFDAMSGAVSDHVPSLKITQQLSAAVEQVLISGYICDSLSNGTSGVTVDLGGDKTGSYTTSNTGYYEFVVSKGNFYTVAPSKTDWVFTPLSKNYFSLSSNQSSQNFTGYEITMQTGKTVEVRGGVKGYIKKGESASIILKPAVSGAVKIKIYNLKGQLVWDETKDVSAGVQDVVSWACKNTSNKDVASGIYIVYIKGAGIDVKKKIAVVK
ncbi:MAG: carboxypeptidase regulatory-like domain-containing protein [Proteobacteria bacterium]|nr:carboxypeptidase regulatory-like domain-containing protein [Pseudomonadota bacterium]